MTRSSAKETAPSKKAMLEKKSVKETATNKNVPSKKTSPVRSSSQKKEKAQKASNLYSKLTVSAAAKAKGANDKPKEFLRAKPHKVAKVAKKEVSNENLTGSKNIKITIDVKVEATNSSKRKKSIKFTEPDLGRTDDSSSGCDVNLSDSNVKTPKHSTPHIIKKPFQEFWIQVQIQENTCCQKEP
ncbi:uncharacterized protein LOC131955044 [Physella acuta]|uniref:uncharacterized protein LOC131955044 n=1 Tax=Physella acuta TaxID=109671 RepID=UPI0027DD419B|nr:uncharacterized protein LOC131955044 [Physella acuta]